MVLARIGRTNHDVKCRKCRSQPETLAHILNACTPNVGLMQERHNSILQRLFKALPRSPDAVNVLVNQKIPGSPGQLRPDLVILDNRDNSISIIDDIPQMRNVSTPLKWAYSMFTYISVVCKDEKTCDMLAYAHIIAQKHGGSGWLEYDHTFRQQATADP